LEGGASGRFQSDRCNNKGLTGKVCLSAKGSFGIGGGAVATVSEGGMVWQFGGDVMGTGSLSYTKCYVFDNDQSHWEKGKVCVGADIAIHLYMFFFNTTFTVWNGQHCFSDN
jgi:hypothetical protein